METRAPYVISAQPLPVIKQPPYPRAYYQNREVLITDISETEAGKSVYCETVDGSETLVSGPHWVGGVGYVDRYVSGRWASINDVICIMWPGMPCDHPQLSRKLVEDTHEVEIGTSWDGSVSTRTETEYFERCNKCGEIIREHIMPEEA